MNLSIHQINSIMIFLLAATTLFGLEARPHCSPQPNMAGELEVTLCEFKTESISKTMLPEPNAARSNMNEKKWTKLKPESWGVLLKGKLSRKVFLSDKASEKYPEIIQEKINKFRNFPETIEITTFYRSKDKNFCRKNPVGSSLNMDFIFVCCDTPSVFPPCGVDSDHYSEKVIRIQSRK